MHGDAWMHAVNTCRTGSIPIASAVSASVSRMLRKPSPRSELSRNRFCATVSSTAIGSGRSDFTRSPSTTSWTCRPSMEYWLLSAAPKRSMKCSRVRDRLPSQMASTCWPTTSSCAAAGSNRSGTSAMRLRSFASASSWSST